MSATDRFATAAAVADAVLREGHVLYPYRPSALKNRMRWQFGVLGPPALAGLPGADASWCAVEVVCGGERVRARVRFVRITGHDADGWERSEIVEVDLDEAAPSVDFDGGRATLERFGPFVRVRVDNTSTHVADESGDQGRPVDRDEALPHSLIAVHVVLATSDGCFASAVDPVSEVAPLVGACHNERLWPVLVGEDVVLACPIILYDNPEIAPESVGDWGDATEIEELLALRVLTLTDEERRIAEQADPFAAAVIGQTQPEVLSSLHGRLTVGSTVTLRPRPGADAHDLFLDGRTATVVGHRADVDGSEYVQVLPDDDPGRDLHEWFGRSWFFRPDEVEPVAPVVVVAGIGNLLRGDDGFGPAVVGALGAEQTAGRLPDGVRLVDAGVRTMHLAYDLAEGVDLFVAVDTVSAATAGDGAAPGTVVVLEPDFDAEGAASDGHGMDLHEVWGLARRLGPGPGRTLVVGCVPLDMDDRMGLSAPVAAAVDTAAALVRKHLEVRSP